MSLQTVLDDQVYGLRLSSLVHIVGLRCFHRPHYGVKASPHYGVKAILNVNITGLG